MFLAFSGQAMAGKINLPSNLAAVNRAALFVNAAEIRAALQTLTEAT